MFLHADALMCSLQCRRFGDVTQMRRTLRKMTIYSRSVFVGGNFRPAGCCNKAHVLSKHH